MFITIWNSGFPCLPPQFSWLPVIDVYISALIERENTISYLRKRNINKFEKVFFIVKNGKVALFIILLIMLQCGGNFQEKRKEVAYAC